MSNYMNERFEHEYKLKEQADNIEELGSALWHLINKAMEKEFPKFIKKNTKGLNSFDADTKRRAILREFASQMIAYCGGLGGFDTHALRRITENPIR